MENNPTTPATSPYLTTATTLHIGGLTLTIHGLSHLPSTPSKITAVHLLHPRLQAAPYMNPLSHGILTSHHSSPTSSTRGLITVFFDQRNHGDRIVNPVKNTDWRDGNPSHGVDMFSLYHGTAQDVSFVIDYLESALFPNGEHEIDHHIASGVSLGGHGSFLLVFNDPRIVAAAPVIGCCDFEPLMAHRASRSGIENFVAGACAAYPKGFKELVDKTDIGAVARAQGWDKVEEKLKGKRIFALYGKNDKLVAWERSKVVTKKFREWDAEGVMEWKEKGYDCGHEFPDEMVRDVAEWVKGVVGDWEMKEGKVKAKY